jgi:hypothetical protein
MNNLCYNYKLSTDPLRLSKKQGHSQDILMTAQPLGNGFVLALVDATSPRINRP